MVWVVEYKVQGYGSWLIAICATLEAGKREAETYFARNFARAMTKTWHEDADGWVMRLLPCGWITVFGHEVLK